MLDPREQQKADAAKAEVDDTVFYDGYDPPAITGTQTETPAGVSLVFTPKQVQWYEAVKSGLYNFMAIGGAIRGTKTFTVLMTLFLLMKEFPRSRHAVVRRDLTVIRRNVVPPIDKLRAMTGNFLGPLNMTSWEYEAENGSKLLLIPESIKDDPLLEKFRGLELNTLTLEESGELNVDMKAKAIERAGSWIIPPDRDQQQAIARAVERGMKFPQAVKKFGPRQCPPYVFFTFNPTDNWVREDIYDPYEAGTLQPPWFFMPATIFDNPFVSEEYLKSLEELRTQKPEAYEQFVLGIWGNIRTPNQLVDPAWVKDARNVRQVGGERRLGGDIARYGKDSTVFTVVDGNAAIKIEQHRGLGITESATTAMRLAETYTVPGSNITIDTNGLGGGTADVMRSNGVPVNEFVSGKKPVRRIIGHQQMASGSLVPQRSFYKFADMWSQAAWEFRERLRAGQIALVAGHPMMTRHLGSFQYEITDRVIRVWSSEKVREELGFSPDIAVSIILAMFDFPKRDTRLTSVPSVGVSRASMAHMHMMAQRRGTRRG